MESEHMTDENCNTVLQGIARHINCLAEENRNTRKLALQGLHRDIFKRTPALSDTEIGLVFKEILKPLLKSLSDPVEKCRELAITTLSGFTCRLPKTEEYLPYIIPVLVQRLGQQDIVETSEELRLALIGMAFGYLSLNKKQMAIYLNDYVQILQKTVVDPYPDVKKESCKCASLLARTLPAQFHMQSESLIKPLLLTLTHQHSRVRVIAIHAIGDVIQYGNNKSVDDVTSHLAQRLFDQAPAVRSAVTKVVGEWLLNLMDRYSFFHKLMPLLLTSLTDDQPEIRDDAEAFWHDVGLKYESENESDLKDLQDFAKPDPEHYPPNVERPNLGCRTLMQRNLSKILPGLLHDIGDWVEATRVKSSLLLPTLLVNAEDYITQHMEKLLTGLYRSCADPEPEVVKNIRRSAELIGYFVSTEVWCKLILSAVASAQSPGTLMVLASVMRGSQRSQLQSRLKEICDTLILPDICQSSQLSIQVSVVECLDSMLIVCQEDCSSVGDVIFYTLITVLSLTQEEKLRNQVFGVMDRLSLAENITSQEDLFRRYTKSVLTSLIESAPLWNNYSTERIIFDTLLVEAGPVVGEHLDLIIPIFLPNLKPEKDAELRLKFFSLLSKLLMSATRTLDSQRCFSGYAASVVKDMVLPNCVWKAGRTAGAIRTTSISCLWALLQSGVLTKDMASGMSEELLTQVTSLMDDDNKTTRLISCRVLTRVFDLLGTSLNQDKLHNMYPELLKRLDDSSDEIRTVVSNTFLAYFCCFEEKYDADLYRAHLEAIYKGLLVHLDDSDSRIQDSILGVLKEAARIRPEMLIKEVEAVKHKHRSSRFCDALLQHAQTLH